MKPFLKWAGGKHSQLNQILPYIPKGDRLFEPFVGAGSIFMNAGFQDVLLNDVNPDLTNLYNVLRHRGHRFIDECERLHKYVNCRANYDKVRERMNTREFQPYSMAAFFLILNRTGFNGMCRYNRDREFNVPWGKDPEPYFPRAEMEEFLDANFNMQLFTTDFAKMMNLARAGDVVFCDPPYHPMPGKDGFTTYSGKKFELADQKRLVDKAVELQKRGVPTVITNSNAPIIHKMYLDAGFRIYPLNARRSVSAKAETRGTVEDILAVLK